MNRVFQTAFHVPGTLAANLATVWTAPFACQLVHVSVVGSNANDGLFTCGTVADPNGYVTSISIGDSLAPVEIEGITGFDGVLAGSQYPHIADGTVLTAVLDYDGAAGTATDDFTMVLTFTEG